MNYKEIIKHLKREEKVLKKLKYGRPYRRLTEGHLSYREQLNVVRFLNLLVFYKKHNGECDPLEMIEKKRYFGSNNRDMFMIISGFYHIKGTELSYKSDFNSSIITVVGEYDVGYVSHKEFFKISDIIDELTGSKSENYESTTELFLELKEWCKHIYGY